MAGVFRFCSNCGVEQPISKKLCGNCQQNLRKRESLDKKTLLAERYKKTAFHYLKGAMKKKVDALHAKDCEVIVIGYHRDEQRSNLWSYSPKDSIGEKFLEHEFGEYVVKLFAEYLEDKANDTDYSERATSATSSISPATSATSSISPATSATSSISPATSATSSISPASSATSSISRASSATSSISRGVSYFVDGNPVAVGKVLPNMKQSDGAVIPPDHVCVMILAVTKKIAAPICFDTSSEEKKFLTPGVCYALPKTFIFCNVVRDGKLAFKALNT
ncbi:uncharacterized protein LOC135681847 [Rhopilema esculentum]|uniref:uncharacterized protein LOC135681847 n=1 Tax=Rhopilema esculentum TaxID=499914 RepID=UPI0031D63FBB